MKIAFVTTQSPTQSTLVGRVLPLAEELSKAYKVHVLVHSLSPPYEGGVPSTSRKVLGVGVAIHEVGADPFTRTASGKHRQRGFSLILTMLTNAIASAFTLIRLKPDVIIIVKSLPENVLAARLATFFFRPRKIILDVDDFELTANQLTSWLQRAAIHWAERIGSRLAHHIVAATPFLADHFEQLTQGKKKVTMIPTSLSFLETPTTSPLSGGDYSLPDKGGKGWVLIYAGSLSLSSGHRVDLLLKILELVRQEIPNAELHIHGTGDDEQELREMFAQKNLADAVKWHGRFSPPSLRSRIVKQAVLIDPIDNSITARAKSSFRVALAAALGAPVVTSDIGIRPYLLPETLHARCFAKPADAADYAAKAINWIRNPLSAAEQQTLRTHADANTWLRLTQEYEKIIAS